jgi:CBS domain-containing protein
MTRSVEWIGPDASLQEAAARMKSRGVGPLPVYDGSQLVGMLTDRDITVRATAEGEDPKVIRVRDIMTPDVVYCFDDQFVTDAAELMKEYQVRRLVVLDRDEKLVGILSLSDVAAETGDGELVGNTLEAVSDRPVR